MTPESTEDMRNACHAFAEHVLRRPCNSNRSRWLRDQIVELLTKNDHILWYAQAYEKAYDYADVRNPYLAEVLKIYDKED